MKRWRTNVKCSIVTVYITMNQVSCIFINTLLSREITPFSVQRQWQPVDFGGRTTWYRGGDPWAGVEKEEGTVKMGLNENMGTK